MSNYTPQHIPGQGSATQGAFEQGLGQGQSKPPRSGVNRAILIATSVVGGLALIGTASSAAFGMWATAPWQAGDSYGVVTDFSEYTGDSVAELYADAQGVTSIEIDVAAGDFSIAYEDTSEATLTVENAVQTEPGGVNGWTLERDGDSLIIDRENSRRAGDTCLFGCGPGLNGNETITLTLPRELGEKRAASLEVQVAAGQFTGAGSFNEVSVEVNAGAAKLTGDARTLGLEVNVGEATVELADVEEVDTSVAAGSASVKLTGEAPTLVDLSAEMGSLTAQLPKESYRVDVDAELGSIKNTLKIDKESKHVVQVRAEAAEVTLKH